MKLLLSSYFLPNQTNEIKCARELGRNAMWLSQRPNWIIPSCKYPVRAVLGRAGSTVAPEIQKHACAMCHRHGLYSSSCLSQTCILSLTDSAAKEVPLLCISPSLAFPFSSSSVKIILLLRSSVVTTALKSVCEIKMQASCPRSCDLDSGKLVFPNCLNTGSLYFFKEKEDVGFKKIFRMGCCHFLIVLS